MRVRVPVHTFASRKREDAGAFSKCDARSGSECLPADIPEEFKIDVSEMLIGNSFARAICR